MKKIFPFLVLCIIQSSFAEIELNPSIPRIVQSDPVQKMVHEANPHMQPSFYVKQHDGYKVEDKNGNIFYVDDIRSPTIKVGNHIINYGSSTFNSNNIHMDTYIEKICFTMDCQ